MNTQELRKLAHNLTGYGNATMNQMAQDGGVAINELMDKIDQLQAKLAAPEKQEPVEYQYLFNSPFGGQVWRDDASEWNGNKPLKSRALYLSAGAQPREPMMDEQIWELAANCLDDHFGRLNFARAIEAHHKIGAKE